MVILLFIFDITDYLKQAGKTNLIAVEVKNESQIHVGIDVRVFTDMFGKLAGRQYPSYHGIHEHKKEEF